MSDELPMVGLAGAASADGVVIDWSGPVRTHAAFLRWAEEHRAAGRVVSMWGLYPLEPHQRASCQRQALSPPRWDAWPPMALIVQEPAHAPAL